MWTLGAELKNIINNIITTITIYKERGEEKGKEQDGCVLARLSRRIQSRRIQSWRRGRPRRPKDHATR